MMTTCNVKLDGSTSVIGVQEARTNYSKLRGHLFCIGCNMPVNLYPVDSASTASVPHFGHIEANPSCPLVTGSKGN